MALFFSDMVSMNQYSGRRNVVQMHRIIKLLGRSSAIFRFLTVVATIAALNGCAASRFVHQDESVVSPRTDEKIEQNRFSLAANQDVIGQLRSVRLAEGDTLPDIARHYNVGLNVLNTANPGVDTWVPEPRERIVLPMSFILPDVPRNGIVINLATMRLFQFKGSGSTREVITYPVGVGTEERPSPMGQLTVVRKASHPTWYVPTSIARDHLKKGDPLTPSIPPGPDNPLGEYALYLSRPSYLIHGTNKTASIGLRATNGCFRLFPEDIQRLFATTPVGTPVNIVSQPYLLGRRNGVVYMEIHGSVDDLQTTEFDRLYVKLKKLEQAIGHPLDWKAIKRVIAEARGIPVPIVDLQQRNSMLSVEPLEVRHPRTLNGSPKVPQPRPDAWSVLAATMRDERDAARLSAIINHQGPHIPARIVTKGGKYQIIAGPFTDQKEATTIIKRLRIDLELEPSLIAPVRRQ